MLQMSIFSEERPIKVCVFTGHRDLQSDFSKKKLKEAVKEVIDMGADTFLCGGAKGADIICGELILAEKQTTNPQLTLICAIPFREHAERWSFDWKLRYHELLKGADKIVQVCDTYQRGCFHIRNRYLVDNCDLLIAIYNGEDKGGTAYTVNYAKQQGKEIVILNPNTLKREVIPARTSEQ